MAKAILIYRSTTGNTEAPLKFHQPPRFCFSVAKSLLLCQKLKLFLGFFTFFLDKILGCGKI